MNEEGFECSCPYQNQAYEVKDVNSAFCIGKGFEYAADVMSMITLTVLLIYGCLGWLFRPKSNFEKMKESGKVSQKEHEYDEIAFPDSES